MIESVPVGTIVMRKAEGLLKKIDARFKGPYKVVEVTRRQNYILEDVGGTRLVDAYPLHKLKIVDGKREIVLAGTPEKNISS